MGIPLILLSNTQVLWEEKERSYTRVPPLIPLYCVDELGSVVIADHQRIEVLQRRGIASDNELLALIGTYFFPCAGTLAWLILAVVALCDQAFQALRLYGMDGMDERRGRGSRFYLCP